MSREIPILGRLDQPAEIGVVLFDEGADVGAVGSLLVQHLIGIGAVDGQEVGDLGTVTGEPLELTGWRWRILIAVSTRCPNAPPGCT